MIKIVYDVVQEARRMFLHTEDLVRVRAEIVSNLLAHAVGEGLIIPPSVRAELNAYLEAHDRRERALKKLQDLGGI